MALILSSTLIIMMGWLFTQMKHPLAMGLVLLIQTVLIAISTGLISENFWFSYILFLVFLGGMLVLFIYMTSLASNEMFSLSMKITTTATYILLATLLMSLLTDAPMTILNTYNSETSPTLFSLALNPENSYSLTSLYNNPNHLVTLLLMVYLLITLIAAVKITLGPYGPLRSMN